MNRFAERAVETTKNAWAKLGARRAIGLTALVGALGGSLAFGYHDYREYDKSQEAKFAKATTAEALGFLHDCNFRLKRNNDGTVTVNLSTDINTDEAVRLSDAYDTLLSTDREVDSGSGIPVTLLVPDTKGVEHAVSVPLDASKYITSSFEHETWHNQEVDNFTFTPDGFTAIDNPQTMRIVVDDAWVRPHGYGGEIAKVAPIVDCNAY